MKGSRYNVINSESQLINIISDIERGEVINQWNCKPFKNCFSKYNVGEISDGWRSEEISGNKINSLTLVSLTLEYLMYPLLDGVVKFTDYKSILDEYTKGVVSGDYDSVFNKSIIALMEIGYAC